MLFLPFALGGEATLAECRLRKSGGLCDFGVYAKLLNDA